MSRVRVLLAEDSPVVARQLGALLEQSFDLLDVINDGAAIYAAVGALHPDVLVTDISLPGMDGLQAAEAALRAYRGLHVVFITVHDDADLIQRARDMGRSAYVLKADAGDDLVDAVRTVVGGHWFSSASLARAAVRGQ
jgi:DNA-binding NarL/FixJ family response regulator